MQNLLEMTPENRAAFERLRNRHADRLAKRCDPRDADIFWLRLERWFEDVRKPLRALYGERPSAVMIRTRSKGVCSAACAS